MEDRLRQVRSARTFVSILAFLGRLSSIFQRIFENRLVTMSISGVFVSRIGVKGKWMDIGYSTQEKVSLGTIKPITRFAN